MARIKVRIMVNQGRHGAPLAKLGKIAEQVERFLTSLATDCKIEARAGEWLAVNFDNGSVAYDVEYQGDVAPGAAQVFSRDLAVLADHDPETGDLDGRIGHTTALEYARIGTLIDPDETIGLGIYPAQPGGALHWRDIGFNRTAVLRRVLEDPLPCHGAVQGIVHAWYKEAREPYFQLRELSTDALVRVIYPASLYSEVARAVQERSTMLLVAGDTLYDRVTRRPSEIRAERIQAQPMLSTAEFERFFGSMPAFEPNFDEVEEAVP